MLCEFSAISPRRRAIVGADCPNRVVRLIIAGAQRSSRTWAATATHGHGAARGPTPWLKHPFGPRRLPGGDCPDQHDRAQGPAGLRGTGCGLGGRGARVGVRALLPQPDRAVERRPEQHLWLSGDPDRAADPLGTPGLLDRAQLAPRWWGFVPLAAVLVSGRCCSSGTSNISRRRPSRSCWRGSRWPWEAGICSASSCRRCFFLVLHAARSLPASTGSSRGRSRSWRRPAASRCCSSSGCRCSPRGT